MMPSVASTSPVDSVFTTMIHFYLFCSFHSFCLICFASFFSLYLFTILVHLIIIHYLIMIAVHSLACPISCIPYAAIFNSKKRM